MKIRDISCEQFAGLSLDSPLSFTDGINVVYGKNESGKSTLVNMISQLFFRNISLIRNEKKTFEQQYFPVRRKGSVAAGNSADGKITLETDQGRFVLSKIWGAEAGCRLNTPDGLLRGETDTARVMADILQYGEGVWSELLLSSQKNTDESLRAIMDASAQTAAKRELTDVVTRAFAESDGISLDEIGERIQKKIDDLAGRWDVKAEAPKRKADGSRYEVGTGAVVEAYDALEDARDALKKFNALIAAADDASEECREKTEALQQAKDALDAYGKIVTKLEQKQNLERNVQILRGDLDKRKQVLRDWPALTAGIGKARKLEEDQRNRETADLYVKASEIVAEINALRVKAADRSCPGKQEIRDAGAAQKRIGALENSLCAMNIRALVSMSGGHTLEVTSLRTGEPVDMDSPITEAVRMRIPGVMEMELAPADLDVKKVQEQIAQEKAAVREILDRYGVEDLNALERLEQELSDIGEKLKDRKNRLSIVLGGRAFSEVEEAYRAINPETLRPAEEIAGEIRYICGGSDPGKYIERSGAAADLYARDYGSPEQLEAYIREKDNELKALTDELKSLEDIPQEYLAVRDPKQYLQDLQNELGRKDDELDKAKDRKRDASRYLESFQEQQSGDPADEVEKAERFFKEQKALLDHWIHIRKKFEEQKDSIEEHPLEDLAKRFTEYLGIISAGRVTAGLQDADKPDVNVSSGQRPMRYDLLSEGTKDTVSLAYRLAVVDHLFPEGGGIIVLDDPLTDMDEDRVKQACALIRECAQRHQVIFLTCREEYQDLLNGSLIRL